MAHRLRGLSERELLVGWLDFDSLLLCYSALPISPLRSFYKIKFLVRLCLVITIFTAKTNSRTLVDCSKLSIIASHGLVGVRCSFEFSVVGYTKLLGELFS